MKFFNLHDLSDDEISTLCRRPKMDFVSLFGQIQPILNDIEHEGDDALKRYTKKFDHIDLESNSINPGELNPVLNDSEKQAIDLAMSNVFRFHREQSTFDSETETMPGVICSRVARPVERVGLYIPGGTAPLLSTAIMLSVPAMIAGCNTIVLATPPDSEGNIPDSIAYLAQKTGVKTIVKAGGAQAIAAMAFGTQSIPKVDKIFGPGNQYVTAAKMLLQNSDAMVSIDLPAGPSEVLIITDDSADPEFVAADLLSQAEHGPDSQVVLVSTSKNNIDQTKIEIKNQLLVLPRKKIAEKALNNSLLILAESVEKAVEFSNRYAPEHLIINCENAESFTDHIQNAGSVFLGALTPESAGDYATGTNHTLPTYGYARMYSGVSLSSFQKFITMQQLTEEGLRNIGPAVEILAGMEGLDAHKRAVTVRLKKLKSMN
ncbi:MAG: histidinol dehydrogenase [Balneolaceae bacterium]